MIWMIDTNILLRLIEVESPHHHQAQTAVNKLLRSGDSLRILVQNASEFWNVSTRPTENNGLGLTIEDANAELLKIEKVFDFLYDTPDVYRNWRELVVNHSVTGAKVHDARIVAALKAHGIDHLLTFNTNDFKRYLEITAISPADISVIV